MIADIDEHCEGDENKFYRDIQQPAFVAHSKSDMAALYQGALRLYEQHPKAKRTFPIETLPHASVVLDRPIGDDPNAVANPHFVPMVASMLEFADQFGGVSDWE